MLTIKIVENMFKKKMLISNDLKLCTKKYFQKNVNNRWHKECGLTFTDPSGKYNNYTYIIQRLNNNNHTRTSYNKFIIKHVNMLCYSISNTTTILRDNWAWIWRGDEEPRTAFKFHRTSSPPPLNVAPRQSRFDMIH